MSLDLTFLSLEISASSLVYALLMLVGSIIFAYVVHSFFKRYALTFASKTQTTLDDRILKILSTPLFLAILSFGLYTTFLSLPELQPFESFITKFFIGFWIVLITFVVLKLGDAFLDWYKEEVASKFQTEFTDFLPMLKRLFQIAVLVLGAILVLDNFGVEVTPLIAGLGIAGLAVALACQDTLSNFFAGIYLTADQPIKTKDYVKLDTGDEGYVVKIGWRSTQIRTRTNNLVIIPNSKLAQSIITNFSTPTKEIGFAVPVQVAYGSDLEKVERILEQEAQKILKNIKGGVATYSPIVRCAAFGDFAVQFSVALRAQNFEDQFLITHEFIKAVHKRFEKENIEIPFLKRSIYVKKMSKIRKRGA